MVLSLKTGYKPSQPFVSKQYTTAKTQSIVDQPVLEGPKQLQVEGIETAKTKHKEECPIQNEITQQEVVVRTMEVLLFSRFLW